MWAKFGDGFHNDDRLLALDHPAFRLYVCGHTFAMALMREKSGQKTPGVLSLTQVAGLCRQQNIRQSAVRKLIDAGLWEELDGGSLHIYKFEKYMPSRRELATERGAPDPVKSAAGSKGAAARQQAGSKPVASLQQSGSPVPVPVPVGTSPPSPPLPSSPSKDAATRSLERERVTAWLKAHGHEPDHANATKLLISEGWPADVVIAACEVAVAKHGARRPLTYIQQTRDGGSSLLSRVTVLSEETAHEERKAEAARSYPRRDPHGEPASVAEILQAMP